MSRCFISFLISGGDASIFPQAKIQTIGAKRKSENTNEHGQLKRIHLDDTDECMEKKSTFQFVHQDKNTKTMNENISDIHRTGAKCVTGGPQDALKPGPDYHVTGVLRIKPGRGYRTVSMSCSDKILKWCYLGIQGGLLRNFLREEIYLTSIVLASPLFDQLAMERALSNRGRTLEIDIHVPTLIHCRSLFMDSKQSVMEKFEGKEKILPAGTGMLYPSVY